MRDPGRIGPMLDLIRQIWEKNPELRLGQLILNVSDSATLYFDEDADLAAHLKEGYLD